LDGQGSTPGRGKIFICAPQRPDNTMCKRGSCSWGTAVGNRAYHSLPSNAEDKNDGNIPPFSHGPFMALWLIN
jgi:hypothetical protein